VSEYANLEFKIPKESEDYAVCSQFVVSSVEKIIADAAYLDDPDYIFVVLSIRHKVYSQKNTVNDLTMGVMEVVGFQAYDLKYIAEVDISLNPALGSGQLQIKDIHHVGFEKRTTWEFCQMLDHKFIATKKGYAEWQKLAKKFGWVKA
jgi:hypothetical protein